MALSVKALIDAKEIDDDAKAVSLGLAIMALTGKSILEKGVAQLGSRIKKPAPPAPPAPGNP